VQTQQMLQKAQKAHDKTIVKTYEQLVVDIIMPKEEPQVFKVKLPDKSHLSMPIYSNGNNKEYLAHMVAVLQIINQKELSKKCRMLAKAVVRRSEALKNLQEAAGSRETILTSVDVMARKVEIVQTQQMLQEAQKAHDKAIAKTYEQLVVDIIMPKEEPQVFKVKLPDKSHLSMPIYSNGNNKEYLAHMVAVLQIISQKELSKKCRMLAKAVVRHQRH
jgi:hypothetical protein